MTKLPERDQWWVSNEDGQIAYICGFNFNGDPVYQTEDVHDFRLMSAFLEEWHHEPLCTGFDWTPPAPIDPGEGWELLPVGTVREKGDEFTDDGGVIWTQTAWAGTPVKYDSGRVYRRRKPPAETWPKYYEAICKENAYVKRLSETKYIVVKTDGSESVEWKWKSHMGDNRKMITESEAIARVKPADVWPKYAIGTGNKLYRADSLEKVFWIDCGGNEFLQEDPLYYKSRWHEFKQITEAEANAMWKPADPVAQDVDSKITLAEAREAASRTMAEIEAARCPVDPTAAERIPDNRPAREVFMDVLEWLNPEDETSPTNVAAAVETIEQWLEDNPAEPIAQSVERTATPLVTAAVESPDDRVEITDPEHVIRKIDQVNARGNSEKGYCCALSSIGSKVKNNEYLTVRCRRRDLPAPPAPLPALIPGVATDRMVDLFLSWRLPSDFQPDGGISFTSRPIHESWPTGTNLFTASQARKMIEHLLSVPEETPPPAQQPKRTPVRLWVSWRIESERGDWPIRCTPADEEFDDGGRSVWKEIKHDADGFYVEGER